MKRASRSEQSCQVRNSVTSDIGCEARCIPANSIAIPNKSIDDVRSEVTIGSGDLWEISDIEGCAMTQEWVTYEYKLVFRHGNVGESSEWDVERRTCSLIP